MVEYNHIPIMNKALRLIIDRIQKLKIFQRNKKPLNMKITSSLIYTAISSYRTTAYFAEFLGGVGVSHEAVRLWVMKLKNIKEYHREMVQNIERKDKKILQQLFYQEHNGN